MNGVRSESTIPFRDPLYHADQSLASYHPDLNVRLEHIKRGREMARSKTDLLAEHRVLSREVCRMMKTPSSQSQPYDDGDNSMHARTQYGS